VQQRLKEVERLTEKYKSMKLERDDASKRYKMISEAGEGGMGVVFKAEDLYLQRMVAIKVLKENLLKNKEGFDMFYKEAKAAATLSHPNIVKVFDFGQINEDYFISMEYLEGEDLNLMLKNGTLFPIEQILAITKKIAKALFYAHERGIIHRDIKPHNIMLTKDNELKITDFGLASIKGQRDIKQEEYITGTPFYMSPEQILREKIDHRTDIYSTGVTLFHLITGDVPFKGKEVFIHHLNSPVPSIKKIRPEVPDLMVKIVEKCMEKKPVDRYNNAKEIVDEVKKIVLIIPKSYSFDIHDSEIPTELINNIDGEDDNADTPTEAINDIDNVIGDDEVPTIVSKGPGIITRIDDVSEDDDAPTIVSKDPGGE
jgi:serine/threonine protein kinase